LLNMKKSYLRPVTQLAAVALLGAAAAAPAWAESSNAMRDQVQARQAERAARFGLPPQTDGDVHAEVVGGNDAKPGRWPFMVALVDKGTTSNRAAQFCGASLISKRDVLTAAHCASASDAGSIQVLVGTQDLKTGGRRINVTRVTQHPSYGSAKADSDVAVLRLAEDVNDITPVAFMTTLTEEKKYAPVDRVSFGMGWGETETQPHFPMLLQEVKLPIVDRAVCNGPDSYNGQIDKTMICAGYQEGGKDTCQQDSGGPLVVKDASKKWNLQVGVVSWGRGCAEPNYYGVYARLATLGAWVKEQVAAP
jgi:secreted trypsin-like serine protease